MKINIKKVVFILIVFTIFSFTSRQVFADFYTSGMDWFNKGSQNDTIANQFSSMIGSIENYIEIIGTVVITMATIIIGIRYMFASAEGKALAKENLMNLLVACLLFFGWTGIYSLLISNGTTFVLFKNANTFEAAIGNVFTIFKFVAQIVALIAILYIGIKYIFAGAEGKAELKGKSFSFIIGIILAFCAVEVLNIISKIINETV